MGEADIWTFTTYTLYGWSCFKNYICPLLKAFKQNFKLLDLVINKKMGKVCKESESLVRKKSSVLVLLFVVVAVDVFVCCKWGKLFFLFIENEWDKIKTGKDLINKFNSTFLFSKKEELEMLAEIFRIIGKRDLEHGVKKFLG